MTIVKFDNSLTFEFPDTKPPLQKLQEQMESDARNKRVQKSASSKFPLKKKDFLFSTPIPTKKMPSLVIRLSDIRRSNLSATDTTQTSESCAHSIPSGLSELVGNDWLNDSTISNRNFEKSQETTHSSNASDDFGNKKDGSDKTNDQTSHEEFENSTHCTDESPNVSKGCRFNINTNDLQTTDSEVSKINEKNDSDYIPDNSTSKTANSTADTSLNDSSNNKSSSFDDLELINVRNLKVLPSKLNPKRKKRTKLTSKLYFCPYCKDMFAKFARHLEKDHHNIIEVAEFMNYLLKSARRREAIAKIRNRGTYLHNTRKDFNTGVLLTSRRRQRGFKRTADDYAPCPACKAFFSKQCLRIHYKKCNMNHQKGVHDISGMSRRKVSYLHEQANELLRRSIFPLLNDNAVKKTITYDELIIVYGNKLCDKYPHVRHHNMIRADLRYLGKHKMAVMKLNPKIKNYSSIFHPKHVDVALDALKEISNWNEKNLKIRYTSCCDANDNPD